MARRDPICIMHNTAPWLPSRGAELREWLARRSGDVTHLHPCYIIGGPAVPLNFGYESKIPYCGRCNFEEAA